MFRVYEVLAFAACAAVFSMVVHVPPAVADEPAESDESRVLVQQAIALIVNVPDDPMAIGERIDDALEAEDTEGTDLAYVEKARAALSDGDLEQSRDLLETAIGAGPYVDQGVPPAIGEISGEPGQPSFAVGSESGTTVVLDELAPGADLDGGNGLLLALSGLVFVAGLLLAWRFRPEDTVRQLRRRARGASEA